MMEIVGKVLAALLVGGFVAFWSVVTLWFDVTLVRGVMQEAAAQHWPSVIGRVSTSQVKVGRGSKGGTTYNPIIRYKYRVDGRPYESDRVSFAMKVSTRRASARLLEKYRAGSEVVVHYDPHHSGSAVLETDVLTGSDLFGTIFLTPFNAIMLGGWMVCGRALFTSRGRARRVGGYRIIEEPNGVGLRLAPLSPLAAALVAATGAAFVLIFIIALTFGLDSRNGAAVAWAIIIGLSTIAYRWMSGRIGQGWYDLLIDEARQTVTLPPSLKQLEGEELRFDELTAVDVETMRRSGDKSDSYRPTLRWNRAGEQSVALAKMSSRDSANALAKWLRERLSLDAPPHASGASASLSTAG
jgi:hypothetical protein